MKLNLLIVFAFFIGSISCNSSDRKSPPMEVTTTQLISDYNKNPVSSDEKYEGKTLIVTGVVSHYAQLNGIVGVYLKDNSAKEWSIVCLIDTAFQPDAYSKLKRGKSETFVGTSERKKDEQLLFLTNCKIK